MSISRKVLARAARLRNRTRWVRRRTRKLARRAWMMVALRGTTYADNHDRIDLAYKVEDPWVMGSAKEQFRFERTNQLIAAQFGSLGSVLEIGCGEGHQTEHLSRICDQIYGLDVSPTAVSRARRRCPEAELAACDLFAQPFEPEGGRFDLVAACEVLYYMEDIPAALRAMESLGRQCLVTYYRGRSTDPVTEHLERIAGIEETSFSYENVTWRAVWWTPQPH